LSVLRRTPDEERFKQMKSIIIGTAGHIDHGKTALVKALTGVDTDRLPEEKARGITIDLGFAHVRWDNFDISFIDVPGHEKFVKNMLAGIGGIDLLMLIVAADESVMPQTREHFDICRLLSISNGIIVLTKKDLVDDATLDLVREDVSTMVSGSFLEKAPVFSVSVKTGEGLPSLKEGILRMISSTPQREAKGIFRLPIDRVFTLKGYGTIVTGTLVSGRIVKDSSAEIFPSHRKTKVRSIHAHNQNASEALAGQRTALNLQGIEKEDVIRGDILTEPDFLENSSLLDAKVFLLSHSRPLLHNALVRFHYLSTEVAARVTLLEGEELRPGESGFLQLRLHRPILAVYGERFILRKQTPVITIGGGLILDAMPVKRATKGSVETLERLKKLEQASIEERLAIALAEKGLGGAEERWLKAKMALSAQEILKMRTNKVIFLRQRPLLAISENSEEVLLQKMLNAVASFHRSNPLLQGIPKGELRTRFLAFVPTDIFLAILERAVSQKKLQLVRELVTIFDRKISLSSEEELFAARAEEVLAGSDLEFPGFEKMASRLKKQAEETKKLVYLLVRQGKVIKITDDYFLHQKNWEQLKLKIRSLKSSQKTFSVSDFKTLFGITRKYAIPLMEQLDREGITRRSGNERIII
jgi:selenocysteine-specific elongation factor